MNPSILGIWAFANPYRPGPTEWLLRLRPGRTSLSYGLLLGVPR